MTTRDEQGLALIDAIEAALRPLLPLFRNYGVAHHDLSQMIARLFVYDTAETLKREGRPTTVPRLAIMTGLTRGEVEKHLAGREASTKRRALKTSASAAPAMALTIWNSDPRFSTPYGVALDLSLKLVGRHRTFAELVEAASAGADPETVLDQLLAAGCVEVAEDFVRCTNRAYIPAGVSVEQIARFGTMMSAFAATGARNLLLDDSRQGAYFERAVQSDFPVSESGGVLFREWLTAEGGRILETLDAFISRSREQLEAPSGRRVGVDIFMYDVPEETSVKAAVQAAANQ